MVAVLAALAQGALRSGELLTEINSADVTQREGRVLDLRVLKDTTNRLVSAGLLVEHRGPAPGRSVYYELTQRGQALLVALRPLADWTPAG